MRTRRKGRRTDAPAHKPTDTAEGLALAATAYDGVHAYAYRLD